jgi:hypothetical protein
VERLTVVYPGDDDNVYFIGDANRLDVVQVDTAVGDQPPFLVEAEQRFVTSDSDQAAATIIAWLDDEASAMTVAS